MIWNFQSPITFFPYNLESSNFLRRCEYKCKVKDSIKKIFKNFSIHSFEALFRHTLYNISKSIYSSIYNIFTSMYCILIYIYTSIHSFAYLNMYIVISKIYHFFDLSIYQIIFLSIYIQIVLSFMLHLYIFFIFIHIFLSI